MEEPEEEPCFGETCIQCNLCATKHLCLILSFLRQTCKTPIASLLHKFSWTEPLHLGLDIYLISNGK